MLRKYDKDEIKENILNCKKNIEESSPNSTTHMKDRRVMAISMENYINNGFEEHYPYILRYDLESNII
tara:strand:- start:15094 stop:15297 length:204 start_codon:yes stop_codon:yes gene_type:complete